MFDLGQLMGNTFVTVDTSHALVVRGLMRGSGSFVLLKIIHVSEVVAISALLAVVALHSLPLMFGHRVALGLEFFGCIYRSQYLVQQFIGGLDFSNHFGTPLLRNMAVRTGGSYARSILIVDGVAVFDVDVFPHFMTGNTKRFPIGPL